MIGALCRRLAPHFVRIALVPRFAVHHARPKGLQSIAALGVRLMALQHHGTFARVLCESVWFPAAQGHCDEKPVHGTVLIVGIDREASAILAKFLFHAPRDDLLPIRLR